MKNAPQKSRNRDEKLKDALKANLSRRKAQARARALEKDAAPASAPAADQPASDDVK